jgi:regulator of sigma E protease
VKSWDEISQMIVLALTNEVPVEVERDGKTMAYTLQTEINPLLQVKMLNLEPMEHCVVDSIMEGSAGEAGHLKIGDEVVTFGGAPISSFEQLTNLIQKRGGLETALIVKRGSAVTNLTVTPKLDATAKAFKLGVVFHLPPDVYVVEHPTPIAQVEGVLNQIISTVTALTHPRESGVHVSGLSGPVGILGMLAAEVKTDFRRALNFLVLLNINLALINLLPVPVLDGGHILMAIIEKIRRRPLSLQLVEYVTTTFAVLLISFMLYVTFYDIRRLPLLRFVLNQKTQIEHAEKPSSDSAPPVTTTP